MDFSELSRLTSAFSRSRIVQVSVRLRIFDTLRDGGLSSQGIAGRLSTDPRATGILLNALVAMELLDKKDGVFTNTPVASENLVSSSPRYYGGMVEFEHSLWEMWGGLEGSVRTGRPAREPDMFQGESAETEGFIMAMHSLVKSRGDAAKVAPLLGLDSVKTVLDIGSGPGTYPMEFMLAHPHLQASIFDLPGTLEVTKKVLAREGMENKIALIAGDYNTDPLPGGFDLVFLSNIIHGEDEATNARLMRGVHGCLNPGGRVAIKDHILSETLTSPATGAIFSVQMLLATHGRDYSLAEVSAWLTDAGFTAIEHAPLGPPMDSSLVVGRK